MKKRIAARDLIWMPGSRVVQLEEGWVKRQFTVIEKVGEVEIKGLTYEVLEIEEEEEDGESVVSVS